MALLREYVHRNSEEAFAALVTRHVNLVYSAALRKTGNAHAAEEITQAVFILLAQKADRLRDGTILPGWLYQTARLTSASFRRAEFRRVHREQEAYVQSLANETESGLWTQIGPLLDDAMGQLGEKDRNAVVLRFFEGKSFQEIGTAFGASENAAKKRVAYALEKLRKFFDKRGVTVGASGLVVVISANAVQAAPAGLASSIAATSFAGAAAGGTAALAFKLVGVMTTNLKIAVAVVLVVAAVSTPILLSRRARAPSPNELAGAAEPSPSKPEPAVSSPAGLDRQTRSAEGPIATNSLVERLALTPKLTAGEIEAYLQQNKRSAESLLAAFRVSGDQTFLREAAASFADDPAVQFAVIANDVFPEQRRQWLDGFKATSPDNALAWYFSALDYFKTKQTDLALQELAEATRKQSFKAYVAQTSQAVEEMYNLAGRSSLEAKAAPAFTPLVLHLRQLRNLADQMMQVHQQYGEQGDTASADTLAGMGLVLGDRLSTGANNQLVIDQLMGIAIEQKFLGKLDPAATYDSLGRPVSDVAAEIDRRKEAIKQAGQLTQRLLPTLNETELANYLDRLKVYGEPEAQAWLQSKYGQP